MRLQQLLRGGGILSVDWQGIAAVLGAVASITAAVRAWKSEANSRENNRQAMEALTAIVRPEVRTHSILQSDGNAVVQVSNFSKTRNTWDSRDVSVTIELREGRPLKGHTDWLRGPPTSRPEIGELEGWADAPDTDWLRSTPTEGALEVNIGKVDPSTPQTLVRLVVKQITITFSDHRRLATYRRHEDYSALTPRDEHDLPPTPRVIEELVTARYLE